MPPIRWTKQQDFCLRTGLLKALLGVLPQHRQAFERSFLIERLSRTLFQPPCQYPALVANYRALVGQEPGERTTVADALLATSGSASWGQPITLGKTPPSILRGPAHRAAEFLQKIAKVVEWGHAAGLLGRGNQLTERGLLLKSMFPATAVSAFFAGDPTAWNPFTITGPERAFLFFHLGEHDEILWSLACEVGRFGEGKTFEARDAHQLTAELMLDLVQRASKSAPMTEMPRLRVLRELASVIADESGVNPPDATVTKWTSSASSGARKTTKNADHQAIPRFEVLADLGFVTKTVKPGLMGRDLLKAKSGWQFEVTPAALRFRTAVGDPRRIHAYDWHWTEFGRCFGAAGITSAFEVRPASLSESLDLFFEGFDRVERRAGHTPFESAALLTVIEGLSRGISIEIAALHRSLLEIKRTSALAEHVFFAAGNEIDRMFLLMRPGARAAVAEWARQRGGEALAPDR